MTKTYFNVLGYIFSFLLGCVFTVAYVDAKLEDTKKDVIVQEAKADLHKEVITKPNLEFKDTFDLYIDLPEVTIYGKLPVVVPTYTEHGVLTNVKASNVGLDIHSVRSKVVAIRDSNLYSKIQSTGVINFDVNYKYSIEAKARSPGLVSVDNGTLSNNLLNDKNMLRKDKRNLKAILRLLFTGNKYFNVKDDGTIIIKKHWYSQSRIVTSVKEIVHYTIPRTMIALSQDLAEDYQLAVLSVKPINKSELIEVAFDHFSNFCVEVGYQGKLLEFDFEFPPIKRRIIRTRIIVREKLDNIKQLSIKSLLFTWLPSSEKQELKIQKALPSKTIQSFRDILDSLHPGIVNYTKVGLCMTGNAEYDSGMNAVYRLTESVDII